MSRRWTIFDLPAWAKDPRNHMPLSLTMFDSVVRIIGDRADGTRGVEGSGFLCSVPSRNIPGFRYSYVVTAHHVIEDQNHPEVQAPVPNSRGMELQAPVEVLDWKQPLDKVDLAVAAFAHVGGVYGGLDTRKFFLPPYMTPALGGPIHYIGILEPVDRVMARSGTIGALDQVGMKHPGGYDYPAHLIDCRTYGGFSGSPVFAEFAIPVLEAIGESLLPPTYRDPSDTAPRGSTDYYAWLCGMVTWHLSDQRGAQASQYGVVAVLPHAHIWEGLMALQDERDKADEKNAAILSSSRPRKENAASTREDVADEFKRFEDLARTLVNTPKAKKTEGD